MKTSVLVVLILLLLFPVTASRAAGNLMGFAGPVVPVLDRLSSKPASRDLAGLVDGLNAAMPAGSGVTFVYQADQGTVCDKRGGDRTPLGSIAVCDEKGLLDGYSSGMSWIDTDGTHVLRGQITITQRPGGRNSLCHELMHEAANAAHEDADATIGGCLANTMLTFGPDDARLLALAYP